ncbi:hypothetical protein NMY22_g20219 [Coprinellus aureogranulatus]|nr:hypothetical protein NMY22_g20219 [Coprinellus aureogranulatus]
MVDKQRNLSISRWALLDLSRAPAEMKAQRNTITIVGASDILRVDAGERVICGRRGEEGIELPNPGEYDSVGQASSVAFARPLHERTKQHKKKRGRLDIDTPKGPNLRTDPRSLAFTKPRSTNPPGQLDDPELRLHVVESLLDAGADTTIKDKNGFTVLDLVSSDDTAVIAAIRKARASNAISSSDIAQDDDDEPGSGSGSGSDSE